MSANALYTDLSGYYDLMCAGIDYQAQSHAVHRLQQIFGNAGTTHLDLACGTGPHVRYFIDLGYQSSGLDINQPMLDIAAARCPEAQFSLQDMSAFSIAEPVDLITCFLYSIHYNADLAKLKACIASVHRGLKADGVFCFNVVDKNKSITLYLPNTLWIMPANVSLLIRAGITLARVKSNHSKSALKKPTPQARRFGMTSTPWLL